MRHLLAPRESCMMCNTLHAVCFHSPRIGCLNCTQTSQPKFCGGRPERPSATPSNVPIKPLHSPLHTAIKPILLGTFYKYWACLLALFHLRHTSRLEIQAGVFC